MGSPGRRQTTHRLPRDQLPPSQHRGLAQARSHQPRTAATLNHKVKAIPNSDPRPWPHLQAQQPHEARATTNRRGLLPACRTARLPGNCVAGEGAPGQDSFLGSALLPGPRLSPAPQPQQFLKRRLCPPSTTRKSFSSNHSAACCTTFEKKAPNQPESQLPGFCLSKVTAPGHRAEPSYPTSHSGQGTGDVARTRCCMMDQKPTPRPHAQGSARPSLQLLTRGSQ